MRDILLVAFLLIAIFYSFKKPYLGVAAWIWIAMMAPVTWAFGFSQSFRLNLTIVIFSVLSWLFYKHKKKFTFTSLHFWVLLFWFWMLIATSFHLLVDNDFAWNKFIEFTKVIALFLFISLTVKEKREIDVIIWAIVLSISAYSAMEGVKFLLSGGGHRITGRAGIISDRNDLVVAINMCIPLLIYLWQTTKSKNLKLGLLVLIVLNIVAVVGTYSRGGFIGLSILAFAMWLKSDKKIIYVLLAVIALPILYANAPAEWKERQSTIETAASEDGSFIGRLWAWKVATLIALDNPLTGGGMKANIDPILWRTYAPYTENFGPIETPPVPLDRKPLAAHNIYFQVLGSSGFVGLFIFVIMLGSGFLRCWRLSISKLDTIPVWKKDLSKALSLTFIGYGVTGLNVSLAYFELVYALLALIAIFCVNPPIKEKRNARQA